MSLVVCRVTVMHKQFTNPFNRRIEGAMRRRMAKGTERTTKEDAIAKRILGDEIRRRIAEYKERFGEDPDL